MTIWLGPVGNLQALPSIGRGISAPLSVPSAVHQIAGRGGKVVDRFPSAASRTYGLARAWLTTDEVSVLEAMYLGAYGPGPYVLVDPWRRNMLNPNQSSGTDVLMDTTGFVSPVAVMASSTAQADQGLRSLAWSITITGQEMMTGALTSNILADGDVDIPVLPSVAYAAQVRARLSTSSATVQLGIRWMNSAGVFISGSLGTGVAVGTGAFSTLTCLATSPATAAIARLRVTNGTFVAPTIIYLDKWQLEQAATASAWTLGTGVPRVSFTDDLSETYNLPGYADAGFTLVEVGA